MSWTRTIVILFGLALTAPCAAQTQSPLAVEVLHTFRPRPVDDSWLQAVQIVGLDPATDRIAFVTTDTQAGARSASLRERLDVVDYRRHRWVDRISAAYETHVGTAGESGIGRFSGAVGNDIRIFRRVVHELGGRYWGHEELVVTPNGRVVVARIPGGRIAVLNAHGQRRRYLLPDDYYDFGDLALTPDGERVTLACGQQGGGGGSQGLCIADLRGQVTYLQTRQIVTPLHYTDVTTAYAVTISVNDPDCLTRFELGPQPSVHEVHCYPGLHMREMIRVPGSPQSVVRIRRGGTLGDHSLALVDLVSGTIVREMPFSIYRKIRGVLEGGRVISAIDRNYHPGEGPIRLLDLASGRSVDVPTDRFGGRLTQVWRTVEDGHEVVYGLRMRTERAHELVRLEPGPLLDS